MDYFRLVPIEGNYMAIGQFVDKRGEFVNDDEFLDGWNSNHSQLKAQVILDGVTGMLITTTYGALVASQDLRKMIPSTDKIEVEIPDEGDFDLHRLEVVACMDRERSNFQDNSDGGIRYIHRFVVDPTKVEGKKCFRPQEAPNMVFVSASFKDELEIACRNFLGMGFDPV